MKDYNSFNDFAKKHAGEKLKVIEKETNQKRSILTQLSYLLCQLAEQKELLYPMQEAKRSILKDEIIIAYENDKLFQYHNSKNIDDAYKKLIESIDVSKKFYHDKKTLTAKKYLDANDPFFPFEYSEALLINNTKNHENLNLDQVGGIVLAQIMLIEDIESVVKDLIFDNQLNKEDLERLEFLLNKKIKWSEALNEFAFIMNRLMNKNYIEIPSDNTSPKKADLFHAHFYIIGNNGEEASIRSLKDAFNNVNVQGKGLPKLKKEKIRDIFN